MIIFLIYILIAILIFSICFYTSAKWDSTKTYNNIDLEYELFLMLIFSFAWPFIAAILAIHFCMDIPLQGLKYIYNFLIKILQGKLNVK